MNFRTLFSPLFIIPIIGLASISSLIIASIVPNLLFAHIIFYIVGFIFYFIFATIDFRVWPKLIWFLYSAALVLLILVFFGRPIRGANRWIDLQFFMLQPSEILKPFVIIILAYLFSSAKRDIKTLIIIPFIITLPIFIFIFKQPDLGNMIVYIAIFTGFTLAAGLPWKYLMITIITLSGVYPLLWKLLAEYQKQRLISFINPQIDPLGAGYNALQAIIAIGSGQLFGLGFGRGTQSSLLFLPEFHTDFIFASTGEELGFIGGFLVLLFYIVLLFKLLSIASNIENTFAKFLVLGIFTQIFIQVFINIGMNVGILPITGITLPLMSYGGSSILSTFIALGLAVSVSNQNKSEALVIS